MFKIIYRVLTLFKKEGLKIFLLLLSSIIFSLLVLLEPILYWKIIDILISFELTTQWWFNKLYNTIIFWLILWISVIFLKLFISISSDILSHKIFHKNIKLFYEKVLDLSMGFHNNSNSWELVKKITKWADNIFETGHDLFRKSLSEFFTIIILIPLVLYLNLKLWLFVLFLWLLSSLIIFSVASRVVKRQDKIEKHYTKMSKLYADTFSNINVVKSFCLKTDRVSILKEISQKAFNEQYPILKLWWFLDSFSKILTTVIYLWIIIFWTFLYFNWETSIWEIVMFLAFSTILLSSIESLTWSYEDFFWRVSPIKDFFEIIDTQIKVQDKKDAIIMPKAKWIIEYNNVTFSYDGKRDVLKNLNFKVNSREKVAFVGHTWSWKSTIINMLLRFYNVSRWEIKIDSININDVTQESLRKNIWVVFQDSSMFNTSIIENIRLDNYEASIEDIYKVAKKSHAHDFIEKLPNWYDTIVWERWVKLSWWEKQRLAIARTLLKDAPILILDEATSALDTQTEVFLQDSFEELMKWRTTFIIAHRLSTIRKVDRIFVMDSWEIVEEWTYEELKNKWWFFTKLVEAQVKGFLK